MKREQYLGTQPHFENFLTVAAQGTCGLILLMLEPVFGITISWRNWPVPPKAQLAAGLIAISASALFLFLMEKTQRKCLHCQKGLVQGEAAFPEAFAEQVRSALRAAEPLAALSAPVGSLSGGGPHMLFAYCPRCKSVGELSLSAAAAGYEFENLLVLGKSARMFAYLCEMHEKVRENRVNNLIGA